MNRFFITICLALVAIAANAQTITDVLRRDQQGQGKVIINQSADIERLVNNRQTQSTATTGNNPQNVKPVEKQNDPNQAGKSNLQPEKKDNNTPVVTDRPQDRVSETPVDKVTERPANVPAERPADRTTTRQTTTTSTYDSDATVVNTNKKIMRHSYKTTGYRIQVYTGGNKREDRTKCEQIAARLKSAFPDQPIYVHFYSPSWKCRLGNFTNMNEAKAILSQIRKMGYNQACMVKGTINVQY